MHKHSTFLFHVFWKEYLDFQFEENLQLQKQLYDRFCLISFFYSLDFEYSQLNL